MLQELVDTVGLRHSQLGEQALSREIRQLRGESLIELALIVEPSASFTSTAIELSMFKLSSCLGAFNQQEYEITFMKPCS